MTPDKTLRLKTHQLFEDNMQSSAGSRLLNLLLIILIIVNVVAVIFESDAAIGQQYAREFALLELVSVCIFSIEFCLRLWSCVERIQDSSSAPWKTRIGYLFTPMALIDLIAIAPFFISLFIAVDLRFLRLLRVMRILKLTQYFKGFNIFVTVLSKELRSITAASLVMFFLITIAASLMYTLESSAQPEVFGSILQSYWWAVVTMTTVGYGDVTPVTVAGKVVAVFVMLLGVGLVALPAGLLAARFGDELAARKRNLDAHIKHALADGIIDDNEHQALIKLADKLELRPEDLKLGINLQQKKHSKRHCPHCNKALS